MAGTAGLPRNEAPAVATANNPEARDYGLSHSNKWWAESDAMLGVCCPNAGPCTPKILKAPTGGTAAGKSVGLQPHLIAGFSAVVTSSTRQLYRSGLRPVVIFDLNVLASSGLVHRGEARPLNPRPCVGIMSSRQSSATLDGRGTDFLLTTYEDRILLLINQLGTLGTVVHAEKETVLGGGSTFRVDTLLGRRDDPLPELCARRLVEHLAAQGCALPLLLCVSLDQASLRRQEEILAHVAELWQRPPLPA